MSPPPSSPLAERLAADLADCWRRGDPVRAEAVLDRHPELWDRPEDAAEVVLEEVAARRARGEAGAADAVFDRFPQWRRQLERLERVWRLVEGPNADEPSVGPGDLVAGCRLLTEIGRGGRGRVFLAAQPGLGNRRVVLKVSPLDGGREHLALARLQHTNVVPLYSVNEDAARGVRVLCMPDFGGTTLDRVTDACRDRPPAARSGRDILAAVDRETTARGTPPSRPGPARAAVGGADYVRAVCWIGGRLAAALDHAHERGLVHLDVKPSNVLLTADAEPMLLDFHLAHPPVAAGEPAPVWLGGTPGYMAPEQAAALAAARDGKPARSAVDGRADVFALAAVVYELLGGQLFDPDAPTRLDRLNPAVGAALADAVHRCLRPDPADRYPSAGALAADLGRHLADEPLRGVRNRSLRERWAKWRRRSPHRLAQAGTAAAVLLAVAAGTTAAGAYLADQAASARRLVARAVAEREAGRHGDALRTLDEARAIADRLPLHRDLREQAAREWEATRARVGREERAAAWAAAAGELAGFVDRLRFLSGARDLPPERARPLCRECETRWARGLELNAGPAGATPDARDRLRVNLFDLALVWADLAAAGGEEGEERRILTRAAGALGVTPVLAYELRRLGADPDRPAPPETAWDYLALGRAALRDGDLDRAAGLLGRAVGLDPQGLWPNFHLGVCEFRRGRHDAAAAAFAACVALCPAPECYYNRGLAFDRLGRTDRAVADYDAALRLAPGLAPAALNRGVLRLRAGRLAEAEADFDLALRNGADSTAVETNRALLRKAREQSAAPRP